MSEYLYSNSAAAAERRLRGLEAIEDSFTIEQLERIGVSAGWHCLEIGAGAGSIARWLADATCGSGRVVATDIETRLLDPSTYEVWRHEIQQDELPTETFDLIHLRHVLIHIDASKHLAVLHRILQALKPRGVALIEESDLTSWRADHDTPEPLRAIFMAGVNATLSIYRTRGMNVSVGSQLASLAREAGFTVTNVLRRTRRVGGGSEEAVFQQISAQQLANSIGTTDSAEAIALSRFAQCLTDDRLEYETRATISVVVTKPAQS